MQIMREIALFSGKIYTAGTNFTRLPVVTVATNLNSGWDQNQIGQTRNHSPHPMTHNSWEIPLKFSSANTLSEIVVVWQAPLVTDWTFFWLLLYCDLLGGLTDWTELPASLTLGSIRSANQKAVPQNLAGVPSPHFKAKFFWRGMTSDPLSPCCLF